MKLTEKSFFDWLRTTSNLAIISGAGISWSSPSSLPLANTIVDEIIGKFCPKQFQKIARNAAKNIRFEAFISIFKRTFDADLKILDFLYDRPRANLQHMSLGKMATRGNPLITVNIDPCLEVACLDILEEHNKLKLIINEEDYSFDTKELQEGEILLVKLHGSKYDVRNDSDTRKSLMTTIPPFSMMRGKGINATIQNYKKPLMTQCLENRHVVVIGNSGGDDFDLLPFLCELQSIKKLYWIDHVKKTDRKQIFTKITEDFELDKSLPIHRQKVELVLKTLKIRNAAEHIIKVSYNTDELMSKIGIFTQNIEEMTGRDSFPDFIEKLFQVINPDPIQLLEFTLEIINTGGYFKYNTPVSNLLIRKARKSKDAIRLTKALSDVSSSQFKINRLYSSLKFLKKAIKICEKENIKIELDGLNHNLGTIYLHMDKYDEAEECFKKSRNSFPNEVILRSRQKLDESEPLYFKKQTLGRLFLNLGNLYHKKMKRGREEDIEKNRELALCSYNKGYTIADEIGDLYLKLKLDFLKANIVLHSNGKQESIQKFKELAKESLKSYDLDMFHYALFALAQVYYLQHKYKEVEPLLEQIGEIGGFIGNKKMECRFRSMVSIHNYHVSGLEGEEKRDLRKKAIKEMKSAFQIARKHRFSELKDNCKQMWKIMKRGGKITTLVYH